MRCGSNAASPAEVLDELKAKGHQVIEPLGQTSANSIAVTPNGLLGAPDPRTRGAKRRDNRAQTRDLPAPAASA